MHITISRGPAFFNKLWKEIQNEQMPISNENYLKNELGAQKIEQQQQQKQQQHHHNSFGSDRMDGSVWF